MKNKNGVPTTFDEFNEAANDLEEKGNDSIMKKLNVMAMVKEPCDSMRGRLKCIKRLMN